MKLRYASLLLLTLAASPAQGQGGINLSWNDCAAFGQSVATFACNSNSGVNRLVASFVSPFPLTQLTGVEVYVDVLFDQTTVPSWWLTAPSGGCRPNAITGNADFTTGPFNCADPWAAQAGQGVLTQPGNPTPNRMRLVGIASVVTPVSVDAVSEYYAMEIRIGRQRTVGAGCDGCAVPACLLLTRIRLVQPLGVGNYDLAQPLVNPIVGWQCPAWYGSPAPQCFLCAVPSKNRTWGTVKGLYR